MEDRLVGFCIFLHTIQQLHSLTFIQGVKTYIHTKTSTQMFIATVFIIAKTWKQPRCTSVGEWTNKLWYTQTKEYYWAGQKVCSGFSIASYRKIQINFLANPIFSDKKPQKEHEETYIYITKRKKSIWKGYTDLLKKAKL